MSGFAGEIVVVVIGFLIVPGKCGRFEVSAKMGGHVQVLSETTVSDYRWVEIWKTVFVNAGVGPLLRHSGNVFIPALHDTKKTTVRAVVLTLYSSINHFLGAVSRNFTGLK